MQSEGGIVTAKMETKQCTALARFIEPWAVDDPGMDFIIFMHDMHAMKAWTEPKEQCASK